MSDKSREILNIIREKATHKAKLPSLFEEEDKKKDNDDEKDNDSFVIKKNTPQFGDIRTSMEEALKKTIGDAIELDDEALVYYPDKKDLVFTGKISNINLTFQFRYNDPSGNGIYIWVSALNLTDENYRTVGKVSDSFKNWKQQLVENGDTMERLKKVTSKD